MPRFIIQQHVTYELYAADEDEALEIFLQSEDTNEFFGSVKSLKVYEFEGD